MKKVMVGWLLAVAGFTASAEVNVNSLLNEAAMWLDAASPANFEFNDRGGVEKWFNKGAGKTTYGDAVAYRVNVASTAYQTSIPSYGGVQCVNGVPAFQMGATGSNVDLQYERISTIRTVFLVGQFSTANDLNPLLGDNTYFDLHRASNGGLWNEGWAKASSGYPGKPTIYLNNATTAVGDPNGTLPVANALNIITIATAGNTRSNQLSRDRNYVGSRNGGRALSEVIIFTRVLSAEERTAVYNYLDAKWKQDGWRNVAGAYVTLPATSFAADTTVGTAGTLGVVPAAIDVASGATATYAAAADGATLNFTGGGTLAFDGGYRGSGTLTQNGGTLDLGGGQFNLIGNPNLSGNVTWANGTFCADFWAEFRPVEGVTLTLKNGAGIRKNTYWRFFVDKGVTMNLAEDAGVTDVPGPFIVTCDFQKDNYLNIHGGTLVVTNASESGGHVFDITIGSQQKAGRAFMNMDGGRVITHRLRVAAGWNGDTTGVTSTGTVNLGGGTVELQDCFVFGVNSTTRALATVDFNGGEAISPNGFLMYNDDIDVITFNGTVFKANADCAKYFDMRKNSGENVTIAAGGFPIEVAADKTVALGWGLKGVGGIVKRGAGTLVLDKTATFTGGVDVQAGVAVAKVAGALGTGTIKVAQGATLKLAVGSQGTLAGDCAGSIRAILTDGGKQRVAGAANGFALGNVNLSAQDVNGNTVSGAVFSIEDGVLYVTSNGDLTAVVASLANGTWYGLPWMRDDTAVSYPTGVAQVMKATLVASGHSHVAMNTDAYAGMVKLTNDGDDARIVLDGGQKLIATVDLTGTPVEFGVSGPDILNGTVLTDAETLFLVDAAENAEWDLADLTAVFSGNAYKFKKTGAGRVTCPGLPDRAIISEEGSFAMKIDEDISTGSLNLTGAGTKEKYGEGTLTLTGGTFGGPLAVTEGQLTVNGSILGFSSLYVGEGAKVYIPHCSQVNNRLPSNGQVVVDHGEIHICGVNPFSSYIPEFWLTNGMLRVDCSTGAEHIKFKNIHLKDSTFRLQGTAGAYQNNGIYYISNSGKFYIDGDCVFEAESGIPNALHGEAAISVVVSAGSSVVWGTPFMQNIAKQGPGSVQFADTVDQTKCTATFLMQEGVLLTGSKVPRLNISAGTTIKVLGGAPLTVTTTLTVPTEGTIAVDLSAIDFSTRQTPVQILRYNYFNSNMRTKFAIAVPEGWEVTEVGGLGLVKAGQKHLFWNTQSGEWGDHAWNQDPEAYLAEGYHEVTFQDSTNGVATALTTIDVSGARAVASFDFNSTNTPYAFTGAGMIVMPTFNAGKAGAGYEINVPLTLSDGGITFAATTADQTIGDIRGTLGAINVPAAAGGKAKLKFTNSSLRNPTTVAIGSGKTLEICANFTSGASVIPTGAVTGDATTKLRVTAKDCTSHMDLTVNNPGFKGKIEVAEGGFLHINSQLNQITATEQNPAWAHGAGSVLSIIGSQSGNRFPNNGWALVEDGAMFWLRGVNPTSQSECPSLIVSNATVNVGTTSGSHLHLKNFRFYGNCELYLSETAAAWNNQGLLFWGDVSINTGTTKIYRIANNPNRFRPMVNGNDGAKNFTVEAGALLQLSGSWITAPVKTGEGTVELLEGLDIPNNAFTVNGGYIKDNALAEGLASLKMASGTGVDITEADRVFQMASDDALSVSGVLRLKTGDRELEKGMYLMRWTEGHAPDCRFALVSTAENRNRFALEKVADGVRLGTKSFAIFIQ